MVPPKTPDEKYVIVEGRPDPRLWRATNPRLSESDRQTLVDELMDGRRAVKAAQGNPEHLSAARKLVDRAKHRLGERGLVWWSDGEPDLNGKLVKMSPYRDWWQRRADSDFTKKAEEPGPG